MTKKIIGGLVALGVVLLVIVALSGHGNRNGSQDVSQTSLRGTQSNAQSAPDFSLDKLSGGKISLADYKGKKPVVLDFWATWCPNCQRDIPHLNSFYQTYKDKVEVIGIDLQEDPVAAQQFVTSRGVSYPIALDPNSEASQAYGVRYTNMHVLIDKNGNLVRVIAGDIQESDITSLINS